MDKKALQTYATWSKQYLEQQIELSLKSLGIHGDDDIRDAKRVGDVTVIDGDSASYPAELKSQRDAIIRLIKTSGYDNTVETFAYTWFNRIIALRFMEVHGFLPHGFRVLSDVTGGIEPEILKNLSFVKTELKLDMDVCASLKEKNDIDALFRYVLFKQCNALSGILPMLFDSEESYLELLLPKSLLKGETVITRLLVIPEETFLDDIEVIGWLYQYYVSAKKDKVFADLKKNVKISSENIPAATQLFTPDWIVRYMAENSLGRIWLESYPSSSLKSGMKYYLDEAEQDTEVNYKLNEIRYKNVNPEDLRILEPCCGSGHILVYLFDLLYKMYEEKGYISREIPTLILAKNLYGLEIDKRASQLASFALVMRARSINNRFFDKEYFVRPQVFEIYDSKDLEEMDFRKQLLETSLDETERGVIIQLVDLYRDAKDIGSLIDVSYINFELLNSTLTKLEEEVITTFNVRLVTEGVKALRRLLAQSQVMARKYDVCITNPPYMGSSGMNGILSSYIKDCFPDSKSDLFACFIEKGFAYVKPYSFNCMVTMQSWMFLSSFESMRRKIVENYTIYDLMHMDNMVMGIAFGTAVTVFRKCSLNDYIGKYCYVSLKDITDGRPSDFPNKNNRYAEVPKSNYSIIPGSPIAYWVNRKTADLFNKGTKLEIYANARQGMKTLDNDRFIRFWTEVDYSNCFFEAKNADEAKSSGKRWFPINHGGEFRKYYGNNYNLVNWENDGEDIKKLAIKKYGCVTRTVTNIAYYFRPGISWTVISSSSTAFRRFDNGFLFSNSGQSIVPDDNDISLDALCGLLNSKVTKYILDILSPGMGFESGYLKLIPILDINQKSIIQKSEENVSIEREDWDSFEISWNFEKHPFMKWVDYTAEDYNWANEQIEEPIQSPIDYAYVRWMLECDNRFHKIHSNEEELNRIFINIYGLQNELTPEVDDEDVTVRTADYQRDFKSFISYLVGIVMGRYSLDVPGIAYAGGDWDSSKFLTYQPDDDGIVPIYVGVGMEDGLTARVAELVKIIFGEDSFRENMNTIADALGKSNNESSLETLNRYLNDGFYADHLKAYQKKPVYWMFSSGKEKGFKCLVYMHRYNKETLARVNAKYYLPESTRQKIALEESDEQIKTADGKERIRLEKNRQKLFDKYNETIEYGQVLDHMANKYIDIDLDDGVKVNYAKFQGVELVSDSGVKIKKDLLVPLK